MSRCLVSPLSLALAMVLSLSACSGGGAGRDPLLELPPDFDVSDPDLDQPGVDRPRFSLLVNDARQDGGLIEVQENALLSQASALHAQDMADHGYFSHVGRDGSSAGDRATAAGYEWRWAAENIAKGFSTEKGVFDAWMGSPGHHANIMNSNAAEFGIGREGDTWVMMLGAPR